MNDSIIQFLQSLADDAFYGSVDLKFQKGQIVCLRKEETIKPTHLPGIARMEANDKYKRVSHP